MITECPDYDCPMTEFKHKCKKHRDNCPNYVLVQGKRPDSEEEVLMYDCALHWAPILAIELSQRMNQMGADMESFRNELVKAQDTHNQIMAHGVNIMLNRETPDPKLINDGKGHG